MTGFLRASYIALTVMGLIVAASITSVIIYAAIMVITGHPNL